MLEIIEKLLVLQDRDRRLHRVNSELAHVGPERQIMLGKAAAAQAKLEEAKQRVKQIEMQRKALEVEVEAKKQQIVRYANQQLQTRKNEEYQALSKEIDGCKHAIFEIENQEIELMEQAEAAQKLVAEATQAMTATRNLVDEQVAQLAAREQSLKKDYEALQSDRERLANAIEEPVRAKYERLLKNKGENVVVGVTHGVCGGCHMRLQPQLVVSCQAEKEIVTCGNCGRILYYTADMDLAVAE